MKITESKLRQMIRGVIREFTSSATAAGAQKAGFQSKTRKAAQSDFDTKSAEYDRKLTTYNTKKAAVDDSQRYVSQKKGSPPQYSSTNTTRRNPGYGPWATNPDWTTKTSERDTAETNKDTAKSAKTSAKSTLDTAKAADLEKTVPKEKPPTGGGAGFGKGKSAGKGKGKGKKKD